MTVLLNDRDPYIWLRNVLLLLILGTVSDKHRAADIALHLWYSALLPSAYKAEIDVLLSGLLGYKAGNLLNYKLSDTSHLSGPFSVAQIGTVVGILTSRYDADDVATEVKTVQ